MKISTCCHRSFEIRDSDTASPRLSFELSGPGEDRFFSIDTVLDSGCEYALVIPFWLAQELGINFPIIDKGTASTANGDTPTIESLADVRVTCFSGRTIGFYDLPISIEKSLAEPLVGVALLKYFHIHLTSGAPVVFEFNDNCLKNQH